MTIKSNNNKSDIFKFKILISFECKFNFYYTIIKVNWIEKK